MAEKLIVEADELAKQAESENNFQLLVKSNTLKEKSCGKRKGLDAEMKNVERLEKKLKQWKYLIVHKIFCNHCSVLTDYLFCFI